MNLTKLFFSTIFLLNLNSFCSEIGNLFEFGDIPEGIKLTNLDETAKKEAQEKKIAEIAKKYEEEQKYQQEINKLIKKNRKKELYKKKNPNPSHSINKQEWIQLDKKKWQHILCMKIVSDATNRLRHENFFCSKKIKVL